MRQNSHKKIDLTARGVRIIDPLAGEVVWDNRVPGFGLRTRRSADTSSWRWIYSYRIEGVQAKLSRPFCELTPDQARRWAERERGRKGTELGQRERRAAAKARLQEQRSLPSMAELWDRYWQAEGRMKRACRNYRQLWTHHLAPFFATSKVKDVSPADVEQFKSSMTNLPGACNRALAVLSRMFSLALRWGYRAGCAPEHPVKGVARYPECPPEFFFSEAELGLILEQADQDENRAGGLAIRMLALTGARAGEVTRAHWGQIEFLPLEGPGAGGALWTVESTNTKTGRPITRYLDPGLTHLIREWRPLSLALQTKDRVLAAVPAERRWVFPQIPDPSRPMARLAHVWARVRRRAGLRKGRIHDLRHTAATLALRATGSLSAVQTQLGHATPLTTRRYAHLMHEGMIEMGGLLAQIGNAAQAGAKNAARGEGAVVPFEPTRGRARGQE